MDNEKKPDIRDYDWEDLPGIDYDTLHDTPECFETNKDKQPYKS